MHFETHTLSPVRATIKDFDGSERPLSRRTRYRSAFRSGQRTASAVANVQTEPRRFGSRTALWPGRITNSNRHRRTAYVFSMEDNRQRQALQGILARNADERLTTQAACLTSAFRSILHRRV